MPRFRRIRSPIVVSAAAAVLAMAAGMAIALATAGDSSAPPAAPQPSPADTPAPSPTPTLPGIGPDGQPQTLKPEDVDALPLPPDANRDALRDAVADSQLPRFVGTLGSVTFLPEGESATRICPPTGRGLPPEAADGTPLDIFAPYPPGTTVSWAKASQCEDGRLRSVLASLGVKGYSSSIQVESYWSPRPVVAVTRGPRERLSVVSVRGVEVVVERPATDELAYNSQGAYTPFTHSTLYFAVPHPEGGFVVTYIQGQVPPDVLLPIADALIRERTGGAQ